MDSLQGLEERPINHLSIASAAANSAKPVSDSSLDA